MAITGGRRTPRNDAIAHYESLLQQHGAVPSGVGWNSEYAQHERFARLCEILPSGDEPFSILDFGCGFGALADFLAARRQNFTYIGYDASAQMIEAAREQHDPRFRFESEWDRVPPCDFAIGSGLFNVRGDWSDDEWWAYIEETLRSIHDRVLRGWSANFLTIHSDAALMRRELYYADPMKLFEWCRGNLSRYVAVHHDYPLFDFTVLVRKEQR